MGALAAHVVAALAPFGGRRLRFDTVSVPIVTVGALTAAGVLSPATVAAGIVGAGDSRPWQIIVIFFAVAYVSTSTDVTGIFDYLAYRIVLAARGGSRRLFVLFYLFASLLTVFTSNDIVILTLTPIIFYVGKHARLDVLPLLFAQFYGANIMSMLLFIGNPTNIIVGKALGLGFFEFSRVMWAPTIVAAAANLVLLAWVFRRRVGAPFVLQADSRFEVRNWPDAVVSLVLLALLLVTLMVSSPLGLPIWLICALFAGLFTVEDLAFAAFYRRRRRRGVAGRSDPINDFYLAHLRVPWKMLPFIAGCFVLVHGLSEYGLTHAVARLVAQFRDPVGIGAVVAVGSLLLANVINNQPMTIFMAGVLVDGSPLLGPALTRVAAYSVVVASNLAANLTLIGALAGLMWKRILATKGCHVGYGQFLKYGIIVTPIVFVLTMACLLLVLV